MTLSDDIRRVLHRNREQTPRAAVLAVLCALPTNRAATRDWLKRYAAREDIRSFVANDSRWSDACTSASAYLSSSSSAVRRDTARRIITHSVRDYDTTPARARKARLVAAVVGSMILNDARGWDTAIYNLEDIHALLNITPNTAKAWLGIAVSEGVISLRGRTPSGERRVALRSWPRSHKPGAVEQAASASILAGEPDALASWALTAGHPAWHYDDTLSPAAWEASVLWAAGLKKPRGRMLKTLAAVPDPFDLDLRLDAVQRAADAAEARAVEKAARAVEQVARKEQDAAIRTRLAEWGWTPASWPKTDDRDKRRAAVKPFVGRAASEVQRLVIPPPRLMALIERNLRSYLTDADAERALAHIRKDLFADDNHRPDSD